MNSPKPTCLQCGKQLRKQTYRVDVPAQAPAPQQYLGKDVVAVLRRWKNRGDHSDAVTFWCGEWGGYGDSFFCGLNCGYRWAVMVATGKVKDKGWGWLVHYREILAKELSHRVSPTVAKAAQEPGSQ